MEPKSLHFSVVGIASKEFVATGIGSEQAAGTRTKYPPADTGDVGSVNK
jgi:hypothetical protein